MKCILFLLIVISAVGIFGMDHVQTLRDLLKQQDQASEKIANQDQDMRWHDAVDDLGVDPLSGIGQRLMAINKVAGERTCPKCGRTVQALAKCCGEYGTK